MLVFGKLTVGDFPEEAASSNARVAFFMKSM
jgi:hypothetical protein